MKNQNDLIGLIVSIVIAIAGILTFYFTRPTVPAVPTVTPVSTSDAALQEGSVSMVNALPGGGSTGAGSRGPAAGFGSRPGGGPSFGGPAAGFGSRPGGGPSFGGPSMGAPRGMGAGVSGPPSGARGFSK